MNRNFISIFSLFLIVFSVGCKTATDNSSDKTAVITKDNGQTYTVYTFNPSTLYQTIDGIGAGFTYYTGWINYQSSDDIRNKEFDALFSDAKISILRFMNKYEYTTDGKDDEITTIKKFYDAARERLPSDEKPVVLMCCWSPKASLKSNGNVAAKKDSSENEITDSKNYGTLSKDSSGNYQYDKYAAWWKEAVQYYENQGIPVNYVCIQNEVDWPTDYESCMFSPTSAGEYAVYKDALLAVYNSFNENIGTKAPKLLGPETLSCEYTKISSYVDPVLNNNSSALAGIAHHLYAGGTSSEDNLSGSCTPSSYDTNLKALYSNYANIKRWQTEFFRGRAIQTASMINHCLTIEQAHAYIYWNGVWYRDGDDNFDDDGLVAIYNNNGNFDTWSRHASYYALRHFSEFIRPGYIRIASDTQNSSIESSAYINSSGTKVAVVLINNSSCTQYYTITGTGYTIDSNIVYQSTFGDTCTDENACWVSTMMDKDLCLSLPAKSVTTIDITGTK